MQRTTPLQPGAPDPRARLPYPHPGCVVVEGRFEGTLWAEGDVVIGPSGSLTGGMKGRHVCVQGRVEGKLHADRVVLIQKSAAVSGDLSGRILVAERGAAVRASCAFGRRHTAGVAADRLERVA